jgi:hypothetical protein
MNPAESATMFSRALTLQRERETTAAAPSRLADAATAVYARAVPFKNSFPCWASPKHCPDDYCGIMIKES